MARIKNEELIERFKQAILTSNQSFKVNFGGPNEWDTRFFWFAGGWVAEMPDLALGPHKFLVRLEEKGIKFYSYIYGKQVGLTLPFSQIKELHLD